MLSASPDEQRDRTIEEGLRRRQGAFFTPAPWAAAAHQLLADHLGESWARDSIVWDPACGTGNLTRGSAVADLLLSTLEPEEAEITQRAQSRLGAAVCVHDFLRPISSGCGADLGAVPSEFSSRLRSAAAAGRRLVFLMNPPYGTAGNMVWGASKKTRIAATEVNLAMREAGLGKPSQQLYAQFMFRAQFLARHYGFERVSVGLFSKPNFITAPSYRAFRDYWYRHFAYQGGFLFRADHFCDVASAWGVSFTLWSEGSTPRTEALSVALAELSQESGEVVTEGSKRLYDSDEGTASGWARGPRPTFDEGIQLKGGLKVHHKGRGKSIPGSLLWMVNDCNDVYHSQTTVWLQSGGPSSSNHLGGFFVTPQNLDRALVLFASRKAKVSSWADDKDEFLPPTEAAVGTQAFDSWAADCAVYAAVHPSNTCCAARGLEYGDRQWDLSNALFWASPEDVQAWAEASKWAELAADAACGRGTPALLGRLQGAELCEDSRELLAALRRMTQATLVPRRELAGSRPELQLGCWDAGLHQLKGLFADHCAEMWSAFRARRRSVRERIQDGVYRFGLLRR